MAFSGPGDYPGFVSLYCRFDDLRAAAASKAMFEMALSTATFRFVDGHQFFAMDHANPARVVSAFEGQLELTAIPRNTMQFDVFSIYEEVFELVKQYGSVRSFAYIQPTAFEAPRFRVEFHSQKAAESVVGPSGIKDDIYVSVSFLFSFPVFHLSLHAPFPPSSSLLSLPKTPTLLLFFFLTNHAQDFISVSAKNFEPAGYTHPAFANGHPQFGPDGFSSPARGGLSRAHGGFRGNGGRGGAHNDHWWMPAVDSRIHNTNLEYWKFNQPQTVNLAKIEAGIDVRTTIMLRNIPNRTQFEDLKDFLDETSFGHYDFSYLRIDFSNNQNVGYAFVNFVRPEYIVEFVAHRVGKPWGLFQSQKRCEVSYATIQGIDCLLAKFRNSVVMEEYSAFRPKLWYHVDSTDIPAGKVVGDEAEFPASDNEQKRKRSRDNAGTVGLFPPRHGKGAYGPDAHYREGRYDRGTSFAIAEEREHEQQRLQRNNDRRQIGHRGGNNRGQFYSHRGHGRQQPARISHESYHNNHDEFDGYSDEQDGFYHVSRRSPYQRR
jgi:RNA recognition motif-containing protein